jgi:glycosyltransferase involved in cell wall biosynthesis
MNHRVLFDISPTQHTRSARYHGGGEYAKEVVKRLLACPGWERMTFLYDGRRDMDSEVDMLLRKVGANMVDGAACGVSQVLHKGQYDTFYTPLFSREHTCLRPEGTRFIVTIHGMRALEMPTDSAELKYASRCVDVMRYLYRRIAPKHARHRVVEANRRITELADIVIAPSFHTKYMLLSALPGTDPSKIRVLYSPRKYTSCAEGNPLINALGIAPKTFILVISANRWLKNACRALSAIDNLYNAGARIPETTLVLGALPEHRYRFLRNRHRFHFWGYLEPADLEACYRDASVFIYPTLNEGFGYPPLEAMKYGTPVLASAISSVPEICGSAPLYFNPYSEAEIGGRLLELCDRVDVRARMINYGRIHAEKMAQKQDKMLDELCGLLLGSAAVQINRP